MNKPALVFATLVLLSASSALAEPVQLSEQAVAQQTVDHHPTVQAAVAELRASAQAVTAERARYRPTLLIDANGTRQSTPSLTPTGGTNTMLSESLVLGTELSQTFSWGTTVALRLESQAQRRQGALFSGSTQSVTLGPGYLYGARLSVTQPLLRGFGNEVGLAELRVARLDRSEQQRARDATASSTLSDALQAYWELWYAQRALAIEREARALALEQRDQTRRKVAAGAAAEVDLLTYETSLSELEQAVLDAEVTVKTRTIALRRAMGSTDVAELDLSASAAPDIDEVDATRTVAQAQSASYSVAELELALQRAQTTVHSAADATRPRLDVSAWVQGQGMGNHSQSDAFHQLGSSPAVSAFVGVELELPLSRARHQAQLASARDGVSAAQARLTSALQQVEADTRAELASLEQARSKIALAARTAEVSARSADAQRQRLSHGAATPVEVRQAEDALRRARLSIERQRVDAIKSQIRLGHLTGSLLAKWGAEVAG